MPDLHELEDPTWSPTTEQPTPLSHWLQFATTIALIQELAQRVPKLRRDEVRAARNLLAVINEHFENFS